MKKRRSTLYSNYYLLVLILSLVFTEFASATSKKPYEIVWFISALEVRVGAAAKIEPMFLSNGDQLVFVYQYCRATTGVRGWENYIVNNIVDHDFNFLSNYCKNIKQTTRLDRYFIGDAYGRRISLGRVQWSPMNKLDDRFTIPPVIGSPGTAVITSTDGRNPYSNSDLLRDIGYFWAFRNEESARTILVNQRSFRKKNVTLLKKAALYADAVGGTVNTWDLKDGATIEEGSLVVRGPWPRRSTNKGFAVDIVNPIVADIDGDSKQDIVFGMQEPSGSKATSKWSGIGVLYGGGVKTMYGGRTKRDIVGAFGILKTRGCSYLFAATSALGQRYDLIPLAGSNKECGYRLAYKFIEDIHNEYPPY